eukprot:g548.t1
MPEGLDEEEVKEVRSMSDWLLKPCLKFLREECAEVSKSRPQHTQLADRSTRGGGSMFGSLSKKIVAGTLEIYKSAVASLLPTPLKVHYTFNLRDFAKIIFGVLLLKKQECDGVARHVRLWVHEIWRVIGDRLVVNEDRLWMLEQVRAVTKNVFGQGFDEVMKHLEPWAAG